MPKVTTIEIKEDKTGSPMKITTFDNGDKVFVNSKWDSTIYDTVVDGAEFELVKDGNFNKIKYNKPQSNFGGSKVEKLMDKKAENIKEAQVRKNDSIAYFNSLNSALVLLKDTFKPDADPSEVKDFITYWRDYFLAEWQEYDAKGFQEKHNPGF